MQRLLSMTSEKAVRRLRLVNSSLRKASLSPTQLRFISSQGNEEISIGNVSIKLKKANSPELVPVKYVSESPPQSVLKNLKWIMQKDKLGQDVFLIGPPGPLRRSLAMQYLELTGREMEYVALSRDTTESDLKQRREIRSGTAYYVDQCAVRAAVDGRVLVLEGIEKAERNVLPVLNNLLENREMQLEDGRFLMAARRYDTLLKEHTKEEMDAMKLVRVSEDFRVIALGLPVPRYHGNPLDPPLRSRFQARDINQLPYKDQLAVMQAACSKLPRERLAQMLSFAQTLQSSELSLLGLPDFPVHNLISLARIMEQSSCCSSEELLHSLYPYELMLGTEGQQVVKDALKTFHLDHPESAAEQIEARVQSQQDTVASNMMGLNVERGSQKSFLRVPSGGSTVSSFSNVPDPKFVMTNYHSNLLVDMMHSHTVQDFCLVGPKGCGKSVLVKQFAHLLGYRVQPVVLYQDMTARDLVQQRITLASGDTSWRPSPLVLAALNGHIAELDGLHRVNPGTLAVLQRLIQDRELHLYDGRRLVRCDRYDFMKEKYQLTDQAMTAKGILPIHPSFRIIGLAEPPVIGSNQPQWLNSELLAMFLFHHVKPLDREQETQIIFDMIPHAPQQAINQLFDLTHSLRKAEDPTVSSVASSLSTRQLLRIARRLAQYPSENLQHSIHKACLARFLPKLARANLDKALEDAQIADKRFDKTEEPEENPVTSYTCEIRDSVLHIGKTTVPVYNPQNRTKVPDVLFYENAQHLSVMEDMLKDFMLGEHLLLVGNQGVGKNKIVDRFLHLLNRPREYIQLHRDTTVQSLTLQPNVQDGVIVYEDSPLVRAVKFGHVLVIDEADKAPTNVTCILKSLVEKGEMILGDGRRIVSAGTDLFPTNAIKAHQDFRMIVLANRPGFPFLGNDFFGALGDVFSCHAVDNPDFVSEMEMLQQYGPSVPEDLLQKLVLAFGELRSRADQGLISYPYSTREVVNVVKHLQEFPGEGLATVVRNVFDFDSYHPEVQQVVTEVLHKHGIPVGASVNSINLTKELPLSAPLLVSHWQIAGEAPQCFDESDGTINCPVEERKVKVKDVTNLTVRERELYRFEKRAVEFTEQLSQWDLPIYESSIIRDVVTGPGKKRGDWIHVLAANPVSLYSFQANQHSALCTDLFELYPRTYYSVFPRLKIAALGENQEGLVLIHDQESNSLFSIDVRRGAVRLLNFQSFTTNATQKLTRHFSVEKGKTFEICTDFAHENWVGIYEKNSNKLDIIDVMDNVTQQITFPFVIGQFHPFSRNLWLVCETGTNRKFFLAKPYPEAPVPCVLYPIISENFTPGEEEPLWQSISNRGISSSVLASALREDKGFRSNRLLVGNEDYASIAVSEPDQLIVRSPVSFYSFMKSEARKNMENKLKDKEAQRNKYSSFETNEAPTSPLVCLPESGQVVRLVTRSLVPGETQTGKDKELEDHDAFQDGRRGIMGYLEVVDVGRRSLRYLSFPCGASNSFFSHVESKVVMAPLSDDGLVTIDAGGRVRLWETGVASLNRSLDEWRKLIGEDDQRPLQVNYSKDSGKDVTSPKHGKVDANNAPHVGGNTWAGGTGGRDTAGLGGKGGPYRLDAGHDVTQISDEEKDAVPEDVKQAAREMAKKAFKQRLRDIQMSEYDAEMYESFSSRVRRQVQSLRVVLESLQAKSLERVWLRHQTSGELDDAKLIEGLTGEKSIYKRRGEEDPELGAPQRVPKLLRFVVDVSGSMYRFNGVDRRLERVMESACLVMEAFDQYDNKIKYDIVGHSGDSAEIPFVANDAPPKNNRERLDILKQMHAHAQFCMSGDHTLEASELAIKRVAEVDADEHFVVVLSDANLERYGIPAENLGRVITADARVNAFVIFIGSLGNQAERLKKKLPSGRSFVCMDTRELPQALQQIFTSTMLSSR